MDAVSELKSEETAVLSKPLRIWREMNTEIVNPHELDRVVVDWQHDLHGIERVEQTILRVLARGVNVH